MEKFYKEGMNVLTRAEKINDFNVDEIAKISCQQSRESSPNKKSRVTSPVIIDDGA